MTKPFDLEEFLARVRAVLRRTRPSYDALTLGTVTVDFISQTAHQLGNNLHLTHREFEILQYLAERPGQVVERSVLLREVWGYKQTPFTSGRQRDRGYARKSSPTFICHNSPHRQ